MLPLNEGHYLMTSSLFFGLGFLMESFLPTVLLFLNEALQNWELLGFSFSETERFLTT